MYKEIMYTLHKGEEPEFEISEEDAIVLVKGQIQKSLESHAGEFSEEELQKSIRNAFKTGLSVLGLIHGAHYMGASPEELSPARTIAQERVVEAPEKKESAPQSFRDKKISNFLKATSAVESSGGRDTNHQRFGADHPMHPNDAAIGEYGFMPNTVKEMAGRMGSDSPIRRYRNMDNQEIEEKLGANPDHQNEIAGFLANRLHDRFGGDESKMAFSWNQGHNLTPEHFDSGKVGDYENHDYVQKYHQNRQQLEKTPSIPKNSEVIPN